MREKATKADHFDRDTDVHCGDMHPTQYVASGKHYCETGVYVENQILQLAGI